MTTEKKRMKLKWPQGLSCLLILGIMFGYLGSVMGAANLMNTVMHTAHDLLLNTVFFLMAVCVLTGAIGKIMIEFGVVNLLGAILRPLMKPVFNLPGRAALGGILTFLSDNPAIITLARDKRFAGHFKKYQFISLTNFGTAFGMGLLVVVFMLAQGFTYEPLTGFFGAICGCVLSTRLMQRFVLKKYPHYKDEPAYPPMAEETENKDEGDKKSTFLRILDALLDGGKNGVEIGLSIIPGVLIISTLVMILTFGPSADGTYTGAAYEGTELLPTAFSYINFLFEWLFGFNDPHLMAFPITSLGAVGAALGIVPNFVEQGWMNGNAIAVCTAIGMCWSGFLSTHTAMLDTLGYRELTGKAILAHTLGGIMAGICAHWLYVLISMII